MPTSLDAIKREFSHTNKLLLKSSLAFEMSSGIFHISHSNSIKLCFECIPVLSEHKV